MNTTLHNALRGAFLASTMLAAPAFAGQLAATITTPRNAYSYNDSFAATINSVVTASAPTTNAQITGTVPAGVILLGATAAAPWTCSTTGQTFDCDATSLAATGSQAPITLNLQAGTADVLINLSATASADSSPAQPATGESLAVYLTTSGTCRAMHGANALVEQAAWTDLSAPLGYIENRPGVQGTYAFRLCNTTSTPRHNVIHTVDFPQDVIPEPTHAESSPGWMCTAGPASSTRCVNITGETSLSNGWQLGGAARRELHYRMASPFQPGAFSVEGPGCATYMCPPTFDPYGLGYLVSAAWDGGTTINPDWNVIPNGVNQTVVGFGAPTYFDKAGAAVSTWQPEGLALIPVTVTPIGDLNRTWLLHALESSDSAWMTEEAASAPGNGWSCVRGGKQNFPNAPTEFSSCRTAIPRTDRGVATDRVIALRASSAARATGSVDIQFCSGTAGSVGIGGYDYGFGPTFGWGPNLGSVDLIGHCNTVTLPMGVTTPVSLQSFSID